MSYCNLQAWSIRNKDKQDIIFLTPEQHAELLHNMEDLKISRHEYLDGYSELGYVPPLDLIELGWSIECNWCGSIIDSDFYNYENVTEMNPFYNRDVIYCCEGCLINSQKQSTLFKKLAENIEMYILKNYVEASNIDVYVESEKVFEAYFNLPGFFYKVKWSSEDKDSLFITDKDIFFYSYETYIEKFYN